ncbi:hypothetical protein, partial [Azospirillum sp. TSO5]|uniref:hypothetical protein n=1 Tax=Azospirillum sp. TSO5 TaxID=716760 RepID=UPI000D60E762
PTLPPFHWLPIMVDSIPTIQVGGVGPRPAITDEFDGLTRVAAPLLTQLFKVRTDFSIELAVETHYARLIDMAEVPAVKKLYNEPGRPTVIHFLTEAQAVYCLKRSSVGRGRVKMMTCVQHYEEARLVTVSEVAPVVAAIQSDNGDVIASLEAAARRQVATQPAGAMFQTILAYDAVTGGDQPVAKDLLLRVVDYFERTSGIRREMVGGSYYLPA